jgi:hypothetical protein
VGRALAREVRLGTALLAFGVVPAAGCSGTEDVTAVGASTTPSIAGEPIVVEVDVFSGLENPECVFVGAEARAVVGAFDDVLPDGAPGAPPSILGFRGLILTGDRLPGGGDVRSIKVTPEGYYIEYREVDTRFVDDPAPYAELAPIVASCLDESLGSLLPTPAGS